MNLKPGCELHKVSHCQYRELCEAVGVLAEKVRSPEEEYKICEECLEAPDES